MKCRKVKEEFVLIFGKDDDGRDLRIAIQRHVAICPDCAQMAENTRRIVTVVRERCTRAVAPTDLREKVLQVLRRRQH